MSSIAASRAYAGPCRSASCQLPLAIRETTKPGASVTTSRAMAVARCYPFRAMADRPLRPPRVELGPGLEVPRVLTGLWQVADMERNGRPLDPDMASRALGEYAEAGFDAFDMADHYGSAELLVGRYLAQSGPGSATVLTKWCPLPGPMTPKVVQDGLQQRLERLGCPRLDVLQLHW